MITVEWRGKPIFIVKRSEKNIKDLTEQTDFLSNP